MIKVKINGIDLEFNEWEKIEIPEYRIYLPATSSEYYWVLWDVSEWCEFIISIQRNGFWESYIISHNSKLDYIFDCVNIIDIEEKDLDKIKAFVIETILKIGKLQVFR